jgi:hypothetical protein
MADIGKILFNLQKFQILQTKHNPQTKDVVSDAYAYAWSVGLYPFFDNYDYSTDLKEYFSISEDKISTVINYLDSEWLKKNYYTFYQLEDHFDVSGYGQCSRYDLICILRYTYLHNKFDDTLWDTLVRRGDNPCEAEGIIDQFELSELL